MHPPGSETVLVRYGEIGVKSSDVQLRMEKLLQENIRQKLEAEQLDATVERRHTRLYVHTEEDKIQAVTEAITDVFGVVSVSPSLRVAPTMDAITDALEETSSTRYSGGSFAIQARRAGPASAHDFSSTDIEREGGATVWETLEAMGYDPSVDLDAPDWTFFVECRSDHASVFLEKRDGHGGLPVGSQQPLVPLVSGGIDSPVAAWLVMKRGSPIYPVYIDLGEYGGVDHRMRAVETVSKLNKFSPTELQLRIIPGGDGIQRIVSEADRCQMLIIRRFMFRLADAVAKSLDAVGLVTGESIGQKSSQTSSNFRVTSAVTDLPLHRPLLGLDKTEITDNAREITTYHDSTIDAGCNRIAPDQPATRPSPAIVEAEEPTDIRTLVEEAVNEVEIIDVAEA